MNSESSSESFPSFLRSAAAQKRKCRSAIINERRYKKGRGRGMLTLLKSTQPVPTLMSHLTRQCSTIAIVHNSISNTYTHKMMLIRHNLLVNPAFLLAGELIWK